MFVSGIDEVFFVELVWCVDYWVWCSGSSGGVIEDWCLGWYFVLYWCVFGYCRLVLVLLVLVSGDEVEGDEGY